MYVRRAGPKAVQSVAGMVYCAQSGEFYCEMLHRFAQSGWLHTMDEAFVRAHHADAAAEFCRLAALIEAAG